MNWRDLKIQDRQLPPYQQAVAGRPKAVIRCSCLMCMQWDANEVERCTATKCP